VLLVDDDRSILESYSHHLADAGFQVVEASDGAEALRRVAAGQFDVLIGDIAMPGMDGFALLRRIRELSPSSKVIVMLDKENKQIVSHAAELGAFRFLVKPIKPELLLRTAAMAVRLSRRGTLPDFSKGRSKQGEPLSLTATEAKNEFGKVLEKVIQGRKVVITKHAVPKAVLISMDEFNALTHATEYRLDTLSDQFDALLVRMQAPGARAAMQAAFDASPQELGKAAVEGARKRG